MQFRARRLSDRIKEEVFGKRRGSETVGEGDGMAGGGAPAAGRASMLTEANLMALQQMQPARHEEPLAQDPLAAGRRHKGGRH